MTKRVWYISWNSLEEPLVHSQVLGYLRGLSAKGWRFTLITLENNRDDHWLAQQQAQLRAVFGEALEWQPVQLAAGRISRSTVGKLWQARRHVLRLLKQEPPQLIHARSYLPAWLSAMLAGKAKRPWLFDARGFWVDEKVYKGSLKANGVAYRWLKRQEKRLYGAADAVVMLANAGVKSLRCKQWLTAGVPVAVIPTCVDTQRFRPNTSETNQYLPQHGAKRLLCVGSVGAGYLGEAVFRAFAAMQRVFPDYRCELCSRTDRDEVVKLAQATGVDLSRLKIYTATHEEMPGHLAAGGIGLSFIRPHPSKAASCPTKVGEYLACGMPVLYNPGIGDMDVVLGDGHVAVRCEALGTEGLMTALRQAVSLNESPGTRQRCRQLAMDYFSLDKGVAAYDALYCQVLGLKATDRAVASVADSSTRGAAGSAGETRP